MRHLRAIVPLACIACVGLLAATAVWAQKPTGTVAVLYAGSLDIRCAAHLGTGLMDVP